jgi:HemY protein
MERLGQLIDSHEDAPASAAPVIEALAKPTSEKRPAEVIDDPSQGEAAGKDAESHEDHVRPITASAFAEVPTDAEGVEPAEELARLPDDPGVDPDEEAEKSSRRFRLF